jgi:hypothetical protein
MYVFGQPTTCNKIFTSLSTTHHLFFVFCQICTQQRAANLFSYHIRTHPFSNKALAIRDRGMIWIPLDISATTPESI